MSQPSDFPAKILGIVKIVKNIFILQRSVVCESSAGEAVSEVSVYVLFKLLQLSKSRLHLSRPTFIPAQHVTCQRQSLLHSNAPFHTQSAGEKDQRFPT
jgi:hypothetical protein